MPRPRRSPPRLRSRPEAPAWREEGGQLLTDQDGSTIQADIALPTRASLEFELSWKKRPDFTLAIGVGSDEKLAQQAFRFEVWEGQLVALRETDKEGDLAPIQQVLDGPGRAQFRAFLDQELGRLLVTSTSGETLADLKIGGRPGPSTSRNPAHESSRRAPPGTAPGRPMER